MTIHTHHPKQLTIVGSGITALVTAHAALEAGYEITIITKAPDPRTSMGEHIDHQGSTFDGMDQRYITLFEGHPYLDFLEYVQKTYPDISGDFMRVVEKGGMLGKPVDEFNEASQEWLSKRFKENQLLLRGDKAAVERVRMLFDSYVKENRTAMAMWYDFIHDIVEKKPDLLNELSLSTDGVLRIYDNEEVLHESVATHQKEGVLKRVLTPAQLRDEYPAYRCGVDNGLIQGGAIEVYGLTFGVKTLGIALMDELKSRGVSFKCDTEVTGVQVVDGVVEGITLSDGAMHESMHYVFHTGAFGGPSVFAQIPEANRQLAAVEGYWIEIENAGDLLDQMCHKPIKMHGKQSLTDLLEKVDEPSRDTYLKSFADVGIDLRDLRTIQPTIDFNNMPIQKEGMEMLGCGSGYTFLGLAERDEHGQSIFPESKAAQEFTLTVMQLALEALYGKDLLDRGRLKLRSKGCKRSWTPLDKELDVNKPTKGGGLLMVHGGGNTGSTTKAPFIASYILKKLAFVAGENNQGMQFVFDAMRVELANTAVMVDAWGEKEGMLGRLLNLREV